MTTHLRKPMHRIAHRIHGVELTCHLIYFGAVFVEGHGIYAWAGGAAGAALLLATLLGQGE